MKKAILILGGGSAYGLAHIGVIKAIKEQYEISSVIGTSMGAIIGGCLACGLEAEEMLGLAEDVSTRELFNPLNLDFSRSGIFDGKTILKKFAEWTDGRRIEDTDIPYIAVAYDLNRQATILIDSGSLADAMRASSSLPFIFAPHAMSDYQFVDGGVSHPLPLAFVDGLPGEITIAVNVLPHVANKAEHYIPSKARTPRKLLHYNVFMQSLMQNQGFMAIQSIINHKPDIIIDAHQPQLGFTDLKKAREFFDFGYEQAVNAFKDHSEPGFALRLRDSYEQLLSRLVHKNR
ncbi:MAG: patatin-like phospholipase family protein [Candidatus Cloacimonetes bacterium]|jgi:NTE family protein|nr:patatin-like phospholipase family protein [Candidatus Cloacimonadota bacterium]MDD2506168.1 patatin-like phospholipase family protein [Candidatus Cloacimonadota bacterium]MDD4147639.1 patatin-like phospholipase family protein [Candidatus Cloacimonadota bacterium]MDD4559338.1 patatin-like phospholipase family protein [Candidatus Cloacimonadota bacterium]